MGWGTGGGGGVFGREGYCADNRLPAFFALFLLLRLMMKVGGTVPIINKLLFVIRPLIIKAAGGLLCR